MKIYTKIFIILTVTLTFSGCVPQQFSGINSLKGNSTGFYIDGLHSRETAMEIYRRSPGSAKGAAQGIAVRDVVDNVSTKGFYRDNIYGRLAYIHLIFAGSGKNALLRKVVVDWRNGARFFEAGIFDQQAVNKHYNKVALQLTKKYGKRKRKGLWKANKSTTITLKKTVVGVKLTFTDNGSLHKKTKKNKTTKKHSVNNILSSTVNLGIKSILKRL